MSNISKFVLEFKTKNKIPKQSIPLSHDQFDISEENKKMTSGKVKRLRALSMNVFSSNSSINNHQNECNTCKEYEKSRSLRFKRFFKSIDCLKNSEINLPEHLHNSKEKFKKSIYHMKCQHVAEQICILDKNLLQKIKWKELKDGNWVKKKFKETECKNITNMILFSNKIGNVTISEIVFREKLDSRIKALKFYIKLADILKNLGNLNTSRIIVGALQNQAIFRLSETWNGLKYKYRKMFEKLEYFYDLSKKENEYQKYVDKSIHDSEPLIPFLGIFLTRIISAISLSEIRSNTSKCSSIIDDSIISQSSCATTVDIQNRLSNLSATSSEAATLTLSLDMNSSDFSKNVFTPQPSDEMDFEKTSIEFAPIVKRSSSLKNVPRDNINLNTNRNMSQSLLSVEMKNKKSINKFCQGLKVDHNHIFKSCSNNFTNSYNYIEVLKDQFRYFQTSSQKYEYEECKNIQLLIQNIVEYDEKILDYQSMRNEPKRK